MQLSVTGPHFAIKFSASGTPFSTPPPRFWNRISYRDSSRPSRAHLEAMVDYEKITVRNSNFSFFFPLLFFCFGKVLLQLLLESSCEAGYFFVCVRIFFYSLVGLGSGVNLSRPRRAHFEAMVDTIRSIYSSHFKVFCFPFF